MTTTVATTATTQVYRVYIKATPEAIWDAITKPEWTERYGYGGRGEYELRAGGAYRGYSSEGMRKMGAPELAVDGEVHRSRSAAQACPDLADAHGRGHGGGGASRGSRTRSSHARKA